MSDGKPQDLSKAISHCEIQLKRLNLSKRHPTVVLWLHMAGVMRWENLDINGFRDLYKYLKDCDL